MLWEERFQTSCMCGFSVDLCWKKKIYKDRGRERGWEVDREEGITRLTSQIGRADSYIPIGSNENFKLEKMSLALLDSKELASEGLCTSPNPRACMPVTPDMSHLLLSWKSMDDCDPQRTISFSSSLSLHEPGK